MSSGPGTVSGTIKKQNCSPVTWTGEFCPPLSGPAAVLFGSVLGSLGAPGAFPPSQSGIISLSPFEMRNMTVRNVQLGPWEGSGRVQKLVCLECEYLFFLLPLLEYN
jgi:hypothetical protein